MQIILSLGKKNSVYSFSSLFYFMKVILVFLVLSVAACRQQQSEDRRVDSVRDTVHTKIDGAFAGRNEQIQTGNTTPDELIDFAKTLIGTPYKYGSTDPAQGFDCSGFITFIFNHYNILVPRSSIDFTNVKREISIEDAKPGDIILFTGTDSTAREVGHMGIITSAENKDVQFIHSTSGKANGVTITPLNNYYAGRFVKVLRVFKQNDTD